MKPDDEAWPAAPEAEAFKLALFALVRLKAYDPLAVGGARRRSAGLDLVAGRVRAAADRRSEGGAGAAAARCRCRGATRRVRGPRARRAEAHGGRRQPDCGCSTPKAKAPLEVVVSAIRALAQIERAGRGARTLAAVASEPGTNPNVRLEAVTALGAMKSSDGLAGGAGSAHRRLAGDARRGAPRSRGDRSGGVHVRAVRARAGPRLARACGAGRDAGDVVARGRARARARDAAGQRQAGDCRRCSARWCSSTRRSRADPDRAAQGPGLRRARGRGRRRCGRSSRRTAPRRCARPTPRRRPIPPTARAARS